MKAYMSDRLARVPIPLYAAGVNCAGVADAAVEEARRILAETEPFGEGVRVTAHNIGRAYRGDFGGFMALRATSIAPALAEALAAFVAMDVE